MATATLEDFIKTYVQNKARSNSKEDYDEWLKSNGVDAERIYGDSMKDIISDYKRAGSNYGALAERLNDIGLSASGYSDYLSGKAYSDMQKRKSGATRTYSENVAKNKAGYGEYVRKLADAESAKYTSAVEAISKAGVTDYAKAYEYAVGAGLSEEAASFAAKTASELARKALRESIIKTIISQNFNKTQAKEYALSLGVEESEATELSNYADSINAYGYYSSDYLEYLKNRTATQK